MFANADEALAIREAGPGVLDSVWCFVERDGAAGATAHIDGSRVFVPVVCHVRVVATTGAGDAFAAGFLAEWLSGATQVEDAVAAAHKRAAEVVSRVGTA